jgi:uncharacterized protein YbbK (DUF523 family)
MPPPILVSACLMGINCRYDGTGKANPELVALLKDYRLIPFCPETLGGLTIPRPAAEIQNGDGAGVLSGFATVVDEIGRDVTREFIQGAYYSLELAKLQDSGLIILKSNSPSCGSTRIYDGSFSRKLKNGAGVTAALLRQAGFLVVSELDVLQAPDQILGKNYG